MDFRDHNSSGQPEGDPSHEEPVAGCFDFRHRTRSFDLHQVAQSQKLKKLGLHLKYGSETDIKDSPKSPPIKSSKSGRLPSASRHFIRVVRNSRNPDMENPHVIHRFSQDYLEQMYIERSNSISEGVKPYVVTGRTILKKQTTIDKSEYDQLDSPSANKHAKFFDEVVVIEFDKKCTIRKDPHVTHREKLHDDSVDEEMERETKGQTGRTENLVFMEMIIQPTETDNGVKAIENGSHRVDYKDLVTLPDNEVFLSN